MATSQMILFLSSLCTFYVIAILFGASIINQFYQTFLWSLMVTCLITVPPFILLPWEPFTWLQTFLFMEYKSNREFYCSINAVLVLAGSWVGAWFIPLDWESPYQVWPIPCCIGSISAAFAGILIITFKITYERINY